MNEYPFGRIPPFKKNKDPLLDYLDTKGEFTGNVWQVKFNQQPVFTEPSAEQVQKMEEAAQAFSRMMDEAMFRNPIPDDSPVPTICQGNQHVFKMAAEFCQCGKLRNE